MCFSNQGVNWKQICESFRAQTLRKCRLCSSGRKISSLSVWIIMIMWIFLSLQVFMTETFLTRFVFHLTFSFKKALWSPTGAHSNFWNGSLRLSFKNNCLILWSTLRFLSVKWVPVYGVVYLFTHPVVRWWRSTGKIPCGTKIKQPNFTVP